MYLPLTFSSKFNFGASVIFILLTLNQHLSAQFSNSNSCYAIGKTSQSVDELFKYDNSLNNWINIGITGTNNINALAVDPLTKTIYAAKGGRLGNIDPNTGLFTEIATIGVNITGPLGNIDINNIKGLSYDAVSQQLFAIHHISGNQDVLLKIDPSTGTIISKAFKSETGAMTDYQPVEILNMSGLSFSDISDIAIHPHTGELFAIYNSGFESCVAILDKNTAIIDVQPAMVSNKNLQGLGFTNKAKLFATASNVSSGESNFYYVDFFENIASSDIQISNGGTITEFTAFSCELPYQDLALTIDVSDNQLLPIEAGDEVTFDINIINQGEIETSYIELINYATPALTLSETSDWYNAGDFALLPVEESLLPGETLIKQIKFTIEEGFSGTMVNFCEIVSFINERDEFGYPVSWLDVDSKPDTKNNEMFSIDNEVNGNGRLNNEDEDDHDLVTLSINTFCIDQLVINDQNIYPETYHVGDNIYSSNSVVENGYVDFKAGRVIIMSNGFEVKKYANFLANTSPCE